MYNLFEPHFTGEKKITPASPSLKCFAIFWRNEYEGLMDPRKKQNDDSSDGGLLSYCVMFCPIPNIETQKKWKFRVFGPSKEAFFSTYFFKIFFLANKT